jgi:hypothetical protein
MQLASIIVALLFLKLEATSEVASAPEPGLNIPTLEAELRPLVAWDKHANTNCHDGHGADSLPGKTERLVTNERKYSVGTIEQCHARCLRRANCSAVTTKKIEGHEESEGRGWRCWLRANVELGACKSAASQTTHLWRAIAPDRAARLVANLRALVASNSSIDAASLDRARMAIRGCMRSVAKRSVKGTTDCLDEYEASLPRIWAVATPHAIDGPDANSADLCPSLTDVLATPTEHRWMRWEDPSCSSCTLQPCDAKVYPCCVHSQSRPRRREHALLDTLLEAHSFAIEEIHSHKPAVILGSRAWWGMGTVGNRFWQANAYYDLVAREAIAKRHMHRRKGRGSAGVGTPDATAGSAAAGAGLTICEIGFNAGHSAVVFLEAAGRQAHLYTFDLSKPDGSGILPYTGTGLRLVHRLYPNQLSFIEGDSKETGPKFAAEHGRVCDVMSIDGGHRAEEVRADLKAARSMSKAGALLIIDDMITHRPDMGRAGLETAARDGLLTNLTCAADRLAAISSENRFASDGPAKYIALAFCHARFA